MQAATEQHPSPSPERIIRWIGYGAGIGFVGVLFVGIICGPIGYLLRCSRKECCGRFGFSWVQDQAALIIGPGVFDILFFLIRVAGTIRLIGAGGVMA